MIMATKRKIYKAALGLKADDRGAFKARFASIGPPPDHDGDITEPGAFQEGQKVPVGAFNHEGGLPVGAGVIQSDDREAIIDGRFYLNTDRGLETYETLKSMSEDLTVEWSYVFDILKSEPGTWQGNQVRYLQKLDVWSIDPVLRGAGLNTDLLAIKARSQGPEGLGDPLDVLMDIELHELRLKAQERKELETPADVDRAILDLMGAGDVKAMLDDQLWDADIEDLEAKLDEPTAPTNLDRLRAAARTTFPDASEPYIETQVAMALQRLVWDVREQDPVATPHEARARVQWWAQQPT
jgi:hypothetical protein